MVRWCQLCSKVKLFMLDQKVRYKLQFENQSKCRAFIRNNADGKRTNASRVVQFLGSLAHRLLKCPANFLLKELTSLWNMLVESLIVTPVVEALLISFSAFILSHWQHSASSKNPFLVFKSFSPMKMLYV